MRNTLIVLVCVMMQLTACTSLHSVEMSPEQLQSKIRAGEAVNTGDTVKLVTGDGQRHEFTVTEITSTNISGANASVSIDDVIALETRKFSGGKTALLVGSMVTLYAVLAAIAAGIMIGF